MSSDSPLSHGDGSPMSHAQPGSDAEKVDEQIVTVVSAPIEAAVAATPAVGASTTAAPAMGRSSLSMSAARRAASSPPPPSVSPNPYPFGTPLRPVRGASGSGSTVSASPPAAAPTPAAAPFSPALLADAAARAHAPPLPVDEHRVAAPDAEFEVAQSRAEMYFHKRQLSAMEARKKAAEAAAKRRQALRDAEEEATLAAQRDADAAWEAIRLEAAAAEYEAQRLEALQQGSLDDGGTDEPAGVPVTIGGSDLSAGVTGVLGASFADGSGGDGSGSYGSSATLVTPSVHGGSFATTAGGVGSLGGSSSSSSSSHGQSLLVDPEDTQPYWSYPPQWTAECMASSISTGISEEEAARRLKHWGVNQLPTPSLSFWRVLMDSFREPLLLLLLIIGVLYAIWGKTAEAVTAVVIVLLVMAMEIATEFHSQRAVLALASSEFRPPVLVWRAHAGATRVDPGELVPGDLVDVGPGQRVRADGRLVSSTWLFVDESVLSGDARGVVKDAAAVHPPGAPLAARNNMVWGGTLVLHGSARFIVTATGTHTRMARAAVSASPYSSSSPRAGSDTTASTVGKMQSHLLRAGRSPLQVRMKELSMRLTVAAALVCMLAMSLGFMRGLPYRTVLLMGLALSFASIPAHLPLLVDAVLTAAAARLAKGGVMLKSMRTAEALAGVDLLLTDKTGTITRNRLSVLRLAMPGKMLRVPRTDGGETGDGGGGDGDGGYDAGEMSVSGGVEVGVNSGGGDSSPCAPFTASTEDMLAFEPCIEQGWLMSSPSLVAHLAESARGGPLSPSASTPSPLPPQTPLTAAATASEILARAVPGTPSSSDGGAGHGLGPAAAVASGSALILDPHDSAMLRFFSASRRHPRDLNSVFLRKLFADSFRVAQQSELLHVLPYDVARGRSSCIRRLSVSSADVGPLRLCCRGSAESVLDVCVFALHSSGRIISLDAAARAEVRHTLRALAAAGMHVIAFAVRSLIQDDLDALEHRAQAAAASATGSAAASAGPSPAPMQRRISEGDERSAGAHARSHSHASTHSRHGSSHPLRNSGVGMGILGGVGVSHSRTASHSTSPSSTHGPLYTSLERKMTLLGLVAFGDEVRSGVGDSVRRLHAAGVEVKLFSGDTQATGAAVARAVGILNTPHSQPQSQAPSQAPTPRNQTTAPVSSVAPAAAHSPQRTHSDSKPPVVSPASSTRSSSTFSSPARAGGRRRDRDSQRASLTSAATMAAMAHAAAAEAPIPGVCVGRSQHASPAHSRTASRTSSRASSRERRHPSSSAFGLPSAVGTSSSGGSHHAHTSSTSSLLGHGDAGSGGTSSTTAGSGLSLSKSSSSTSLSLRVPPSVGAQYDLSASVYCRMTPADKLNLVKLHQSAGRSVLATGDGLGDGAALACADAGMAMGGAGTDLAREHAGMVLVRDDFRAVLAALTEGRRALRNLSHAACFLLSSKAALLLLFLAPLALGLDVPLAPLHVVLLACMLDMGAAWALTAEPAPADLMRRAAPGRWASKRLLRGKSSVGSVAAGAALMLLAVGSVLLVAHHMEIAPVEEQADAHAAAMAAALYSPSSSFPLMSASSSFPLLLASSPSFYSERERLAAGEERIEEAAGRSSSAAPSHSSSNFFPSILPRFKRDPHLALTQSLVFLAWVLASLFLATLVRGGRRSFLFACCDRQSVRACRRARRAKAAAAAAAADQEEQEEQEATAGGSAVAPPTLSSALLGSSRPGGYQSLAQSSASAAAADLEGGPGLGAHAAFQLPPTPQRGGRGGGRSSRGTAGGGDLSDGDSESSQGSPPPYGGGSRGGGGANRLAELEGLHRPRSRAHSPRSPRPRRRRLPLAAWLRWAKGGGGDNGNGSEPRGSGSSDTSSSSSSCSSLLAPLFPLLRPRALLLWSLACGAATAALLLLPWLRAPLQLAPLTLRVSVPALLGRAAPTFPAYAPALALPAAVFAVAEVVKCAASCRAQARTAKPTAPAATSG